MVSRIRRVSVPSIFILAGILVLSGCATRKYVRQQTQALQPSIQEAQNGVKENAERIDGVDRRAQQGIAAAATADQKATAAQQSAQGANQAAQAADRKADTANQGVQQAETAQSSANQAQSTANAAGGAAMAAGALGVMNADAISMVNKRVSDLGDYKTVAEAGIYFPTGQANLDDAAKADLDKLAAMVSTVENYMIEVAGYASTTGTKELNQKLSDDRATAVVLYLRNQKSIPMRRILAPAGYGATHPAADNTDSMGRAMNQRVDVKVLVNKGLSQGM
jgi:outer membrane protein OmpA-like peptidoglycan-associated protein